MRATWSSVNNMSEMCMRECVRMLNYLHIERMHKYICACVSSRGHIFVCVREKYICVQRGQALIT